MLPEDKATIHPIDVSTLSKGDTIPASQIERIYGVKREEAAFRYKAMALRVFIHHHTEFTVKHEGDGLRVLEDEEAVDYTDNRFHGHLGRMARNHDRAMRVDVTKVLPETETRHARNLEVNSRILSAALKEKTLPPPKHTPRQVPGLKKRDDK